MSSTPIEKGQESTSTTADSPKPKVGIIGSGSWATALAKILLETQEEVNWYFRFKDTVRKFRIGRHNPSYLVSVEFDVERIHFYTDLNKVIKASDIILLVTPSPYIKGMLDKVDRSELEGKFILNAIKGIIPDDYVLISDYMSEHFEIPREMIGIVSGPSHAEEVALDRISYLTVGCSDLQRAEELSTYFRSSYVYTQVSSDVAGIEYGSVLKNVYAIAAGICQGLRMGDNFQAVLISNATAEMQRFVNSVSSSPRSITDTVYLGDLLVTAYSKLSRNRTFGTMLGKGMGVKQAQLEMEMIAEGYYGAKCIHEVNKEFKLNMPIVDAVYQILYHKAQPKATVETLLTLLK